MGNPSLKSQVEMGIIARFADELQRRGVAMAGPPRPGDPNKFEPDALFDTPDGATLGIETTAGHYSREEAKWLWDVLRGQPERSPRWMRPGEDPRLTARRAPVLVNFTDDLIAAIRDLLSKKIGKTYTAPSYLLIDLRGAFLTISEQADELVDAIELPSDHGFVGVFLAVNRNWSSEVDFFDLS